MKANLQPNFDKRGGLIHVIIQDAQSLEVLGHGSMNREAYELTLKDGQLWLWSASRQELWHKGVTSNGICTVVSLVLDCDQDCLLAAVTVEGSGYYCHDHTHSCFHEPMISTGGPTQEVNP